MRFLIDECTGPAVAYWLESQEHDVVSVYNQFRGIDDDEVIQKCIDENRIFVTNDKDFERKYFVKGYSTKG